MSERRKMAVGYGAGLLTVVSRDLAGKSRWHWMCRCDCGGGKSVHSSALFGGLTRSCGCLKRRTRRRPEVTGNVVRIFTARGPVAVVDLIDAEVASFNWTASPSANTWYVHTRLFGQTTKLHRLIAERAGISTAQEIDRIDRDALNCRRSNLRAATHSQNQQNKNLPRNNTSGSKVVSLDMRSSKWQAFINKDGKRVYLGVFHDKSDAVSARAAAAAQFHTFSNDQELLELSAREGGR